MRVCLWCNQTLEESLYWTTFIRGSSSGDICEECHRRLALIKGNVCKKCHRPSEVSLCSDCQKWEVLFDGEDPLISNKSTFQYNEFIKEVIAKWKYRGDYQLINLFTSAIQKTVNHSLQEQLSESLLVPIPLSEERLKVRGFNQSLAIAKRMTKHQSQICSLLERTHTEKQSQKTRRQRVFSKNPFKLTKKTNKSVVLVDDIYTTGTTLRHAAKLLKQNGCPAVYAYSLIRG